MKVGVNLINYGPGVSPNSLARWARLAEALGYHFVMASDHVANTPDVQAEYPVPFYDPFVTPPIWVGGSSEAALRRAVRYGDGWHPNNFRLDWLRTEGLPRLKQIAREEGKPVPSLSPRIRLRLTESPLHDKQRLPGEGTLEQVHVDLQTLELLGAEYVLLDTFYGDLEATRHHERAWNMLATLAASVLDLQQQRSR